MLNPSKTIVKIELVKKTIKFIAILALGCNSSILFGFQQTIFSSVQNSLSNKNIKVAYTELGKIDTLNISKYDKATWLYYMSDYYYKTDNHHLAYKTILKSKSLFLRLHKINDVIDCNILLLAIISHQNNLNYNDKKIIKELEDFAKKKKDSNALRTIYFRIASKYIHLEQGEKAIEYFKKVIPIIIKQKDCVRIGHCYDNIGTAFENTSPKQLDSSIYYRKKAIPFYIKYKDVTALAYNYNNQGQYYKQIKDYTNALKYYKMADSIPLTKHIAKSKLIFYQNIAGIYSKMNDYKNENIYLKKISILKDSINDYEQNIAIADLDKKYKTAEKEKEITKQRYYLILAAILILLGTIIAYLSLKNSNKKRLLAEQQKSLAQQKNLTLLKEQEITAINAMVEGQEKERVRIAEDLHDNIGSVLATLKLHFENLKINRDKKHFNQDALYEKTETLIDEAYLKIRSIAHAKNSGVIANKGLLVAIKLMAEKVSDANKITINVLDFGLDKPLENSLELTLFRIIQELVTNIIKHANASEATINISQFESHLNLIIEDNGIGFNSNLINFNEGMGLGSIQKRIEHLSGTFEIDSTKGKGTSIIIDIPLQNT